MGKKKKQKQKRKTDEYKNFVLWEADKKAFSDEVGIELKKDEDFAKYIKVERTTLSKWRAEEGHDEKVQEIYNKTHLRRLLKVRKRNFTEALTGSHKDRELWFRYEDKWNPTEKVEHSGSVEITGSDIKNALKRSGVKVGENDSKSNA